MQEALLPGGLMLQVFRGKRLQQDGADGVRRLNVEGHQVLMRLNKNFHRKSRMMLLTLAL
jgi:pimeloyl-CoA synthetase